MEKFFNTKFIESKFLQYWQQHACFRNDDLKLNKDAKCFAMMMPPPNVTGSLHMGHAFQNTLMDIVVRVNKMKGLNVYWQPGTDHAGIATQMIVERKLEQQQGKTRYDLGRDKFLEAVWQWKEESGNTIVNQLTRLGIAVDWSDAKFTMDEDLSVVVRDVFIQLYNKGVIYRGKRLVNWDPVLLTAISDLEVVNEEEQGFLYTVKYPFVDDSGYMTIATTRPETILADGALAINPKDNRYLKFVGKQVWVPMTDRKIPIIIDDYVDSEFGTGCVKITPAHDFNDYQVGQRHEMEVINLFTPRAVMNENAPQRYVGLDRFDAREKIVKDLQEAGLLVKIEPHALKKPRGDRSGAVIEPYLTDQWFVNTKEMASRALNAVENGELNFIPDNWRSIYNNWLSNIQDWCISRQLWWGHRIPAWYDKAGNIYVGTDESSIRNEHSLDSNVQLSQDDDVLDTWFSSALWPFSTLGWPKQTTKMEYFYPNSLLITGFDIIFFWVARMVMMGLELTDSIPFKKVYVHGLVRDSEGNKMSKSKGNIIDPLDIVDGISKDELLEKRSNNLMQLQLKRKIIKQTIKEFPNGIEAFGADSIRFSFSSLASTGRDIKFDINRCRGYRNFCNKLWNAARFIIMLLKLEQEENLKKVSFTNLDTIDKWIISKLEKLKNELDQKLSDYRFDLASNLLYEFVWNDFCDWYIELTKISKTASNYQTLAKALYTIIRLLNPFIPFITEEIYTELKPYLKYYRTEKDLPDCLANSKYPLYKHKKYNPNLEDRFSFLVKLVSNLRKIKSQRQISPKVKLKIKIINMVNKDYFLDFQNIIIQMANLESIEFIDLDSNAIELILASNKHEVFAINDGYCALSLNNLIDFTAQKAQLQKQKQNLEMKIDKIKAKLNNQGFIANAPKEIAEKQKQKLAQLLKEFETTKKQIL